MEYEDRFWSKVERKSDAECWLWKGAIGLRGYGRFSLRGKVVLAHRVSWELLIGEIPEERTLYKQCGTSGCVNPNHWSYECKLFYCEWDIRDAIDLYENDGYTISDLVLKFGFSYPYARRIVRREAWKELKDES